MRRARGGARDPERGPAGASAAVMDAKEIMLYYGDYFTLFLTEISGIFANNLPLSS